MFDIFIKFSDYSILVRSLVVGWIIYSAILAIVAIFAKPVNTEKQKVDSSRSSIIMNGVTSVGNGKGGIYIEGDIDINMKNVKTKDNKGPGITVVSKPTKSK